MAGLPEIHAGGTAYASAITRWVNKPFSDKSLTRYALPTQSAADCQIGSSAAANTRCTNDLAGTPALAIAPASAFCTSTRE